MKLVFISFCHFNTVGKKQTNRQINKKKNPLPAMDSPMCVRRSDALRSWPIQHLQLHMQSPGLHILISVQQAPERFFMFLLNLFHVLFSKIVLKLNLQNPSSWLFYFCIFISFFIGCFPPFTQGINFLSLKNTAKSYKWKLSPIFYLHFH